MEQSTISKVLSGIAALLIFGVSSWIIYLAVGAYLKASNNVQLGVATALISIFAIIYNNSRQQSREIKTRHFSEKREAYQKFFNLMFDMFDAQKRGVEISEDEAVLRMRSVVKEMMIWGSAETINNYNAFLKRSTSSEKISEKEVFQGVETLLLSFRRDLGHNDKKLEPLGLTKLIVKADDHEKLI